MESYIGWFFQGILLIPVTLLPIINPLSSAPVFAATAGNNPIIAHKLARQVAINAWFVMLTSMLVGTYVLALFGISLPVVRIGGGLLVAATAWQMLGNSDDDEVHAAAARDASALTEAEAIRRSLFPITFPLTTGPGTIAASIALGAQIPTEPVKYALGVVTAATGAAIASLSLYFIFKNSVAVLSRLGTIGTLVMVRMMAFMLLCIGIQIIWTGWAELNGIATG